MNKNGFSKESKELIAKYEAAGWTFRLSSKGHAIGQAPNDYPLTCSVPRKMLNARSDKNCHADYERNMREQDCYRRFAAISPRGQDEMRRGISPLSDPSDETVARGLDKAARELLLTEARIESEQVTDYALEALTAPEEKRPHSTTALAVGITVQGKFRIVAYECLKCEQRFDKARSVGQHSRTCNGQGNVAQTERKPDGAPRLAPQAPKHTPDSTPVGDALALPVETPEPILPAVEPDSLERTEGVIPVNEPAGPVMAVPVSSVRAFEHPQPSDALEMIREIVAPDLLSLLADRDAEIARLTSRLERVTADLEAIEGMIGSMKKGE